MQHQSLHLSVHQRLHPIQQLLLRPSSSSNCSSMRRECRKIRGHVLTRRTRNSNNSNTLVNNQNSTRWVIHLCSDKLWHGRYHSYEIWIRVFFVHLVSFFTFAMSLFLFTTSLSNKSCSALIDERESSNTCSSRVKVDASR